MCELGLAPPLDLSHRVHASIGLGQHVGGVEDVGERLCDTRQLLGICKDPNENFTRFVNGWEIDRELTRILH